MKWSHLVLLATVFMTSGCIRHYHSMPAPRGHDGHHQQYDRKQNHGVEERYIEKGYSCPKGQAKKGRC